MKVTVSVVMRNRISLEVPSSEREKIEAIDCPLDLDDFEARSGLTLDMDELLNAPDDIEIDDIDVSGSRDSGSKESP